MVKRITVSFSTWVYEQYLQGNQKLNRSKYIEEMFVKGVTSELGEFQGVQAKAIQVIKENRAKDETISNLQRELALAKSRVMTQEKRQEIRDAKARSKAMTTTAKNILLETLEEGDLQ